MDREYKSKVGWSYHLLLLIMAAATVLTFVKGGNPIGMIGLLLLTLLCVHMLLSTWYRITADGWLIVHCSIFPVKKIAVADITALASTVNPVSAPALSMDRLEIWVGGKLWNLVSPNDKQGFVKQIKKMNPNVEIKGFDSMSQF